MSTDPSPRRGDVDVVVPVFGGLRHVRGCLQELGRWSGDVDHRLIVVDDASDAHTHRALRRLVEDGWGPDGLLLTNEENLGFLRTANRGMRAGASPAVVLLNSDTLPTPGWLSGLLCCLESARDVGIVSPTSNYSSLTRIAVPYGVDHLRMAEAVRRVSPHDHPELGLVSGFCLAMRRSMLEELDFFDEAFGRGYFEETDLCLRARDAGWRVLADDATYVHHHGWGSFGSAGYDELMTANRERFRERWSDADREIKRRIRARAPFRELERRVRVALRGQAQVAPRRELVDHRSRRTAEQARRGELAVAEHLAPPTSTLHPLEHWPVLLTRRPPVPAEAGDLLVLVDHLRVTPFTTALLAVVDRVASLGLRVSLATTGAFDVALYSDPCRVRPFVLEGPDEAAATLPAHRLLVATSPRTVFDAVLLAARHGSRVATWFEPQAAPVTTGWPDEGWAGVLAPSLADAHLGPALPEPLPSDAARHEVPPGIDTDLYRPPGERAGREGVLVPHDAAAGPAAGAAVAEAVAALEAAGVGVTLYGHAPPGGTHAPVVPWSPQEEEHRLLVGHAAVLEVAPVPGLERLRLRCAATATPLVAAGPVGRTCALRPTTEVAVAPRGDVRRATELALAALRQPATWRPRLEAALARAEGHDTEREAAALAAAVEAVLADGPGRARPRTPATTQGET